jgi:hypothetical protein
MRRTAKLGLARRMLGDREGGTAHLTASVAAYQAALEERTRDPSSAAHLGGAA